MHIDIGSGVSIPFHKRKVNRQDMLRGIVGPNDACRDMYRIAGIYKTRRFEKPCHDVGQISRTECPTNIPFTNDPIRVQNMPIIIRISTTDKKTLVVLLQYAVPVPRLR